MLQIFEITFPFFALVLAGYIAARQGWLPLQAIPGLNGFVLYFALPCMLFRFGASLPLAQLLDPAAFFTYLLCALGLVAFAVAISLNSKIGWKDGALGALVAAFPNTGFMGVPLLVALLGSAAAGPAIVTILVDLVVTSSLCIALSTLDAHDGASTGRALKNALWGVAKNPMPWAICLGGVASALRSHWQLELPPPVLATLGMLADAASPVALFTIGCVLARSQILTQQGHATPTAPKRRRQDHHPQRRHTGVHPGRRTRHPGWPGHHEPGAPSRGRRGSRANLPEYRAFRGRDGRR